MSSKTLLTNTFIYALGELLPRIVSFVLLPIFTQYLSTDDYGIIGYTNSIMMFLFVLSSLALNTYILRAYYETQIELDRKKMIGNVVAIILVFNLIILVFSFLVGPTIARIVKIQIPFYPYLSLTLVNNFLEVFSIIPLVIFRIKEQAKWYVIINSVRSVLLFLVTYILIVKFNWGVSGNFYGRLLVNLLFIPIYVLIIYRNTKLNFSLNWAFKALKFSLPLIPGAIAYLVISMSDRIILERYVSLSQIGIYSVAYTLALSINVIIQSGYRAFEPEIYKKFSTDLFMPFINAIYKRFMFFVFLLASVLVIFSKDILSLIAKGDFVEGYKIIPFILIGVIATGQNAILGSIAVAENKTKLASLSVIIGGLSSIVFNILFIPKFGIYSAAFASGIAFLVINVINYKGIFFKPTALIRRDLISIILFIVLSFSLMLLSHYYELTLGLLSIKFLILFFISYVFFQIYGLSIINLKKLVFSSLRKNDRYF